MSLDQHYVWDVRLLTGEHICRARFLFIKAASPPNESLASIFGLAQSMGTLGEVVAPALIS